MSTFAGSAGVTGSTDGTGSGALFNFPFGIAADTSGNVYVADTYNGLIRKITPAGAVSTLAGGYGGPYGVAVDSSGDIYFPDGNVIWEIPQGGSATTLAGTGSSGSDDGPGSLATFKYPWGVAVDQLGNVYVADTGNNTIRRITLGGAVTTLAGSAGVTSGYVEGQGSIARFNQPRGIAVDATGNVYVADSGNNAIRKITPSGSVTTMAGGFGGPEGVAVDSSGSVYVADSSNRLIRKITADGVVSTLAGTGAQGSTNGPGSSASFYWPAGVVADDSGIVYVADTDNHLIRKIQ